MRQGQYSLPRLMLTKGTSRVSCTRTRLRDPCHMTRSGPAKAGGTELRTPERRGIPARRSAAPHVRDRCAARNVSNSEATTLYAPAWKRVLFFVAGVGLIGISSILTVTITLANLEIALSSALSRKPPGSHKLFYARHRLHRKVGRGSC